MATVPTVQIQLTAAGIALAAGGTLQISALGKSFSFTAGVAQAVKADDWTWLRTRPDPADGQLLFEAVPTQPAAAGSKTPAPAASQAAGPVAVPNPAKPVAASTPASAEASTDTSKETPGK